jgi:hypothetical protein
MVFSGTDTNIRKVIKTGIIRSIKHIALSVNALNFKRINRNKSD